MGVEFGEVIEKMGARGARDKGEKARFRFCEGAVRWQFAA